MGLCACMEYRSEVLDFAILKQKFLALGRNYTQLVI